MRMHQQQVLLRSPHRDDTDFFSESDVCKIYTMTVGKIIEGGTQLTDTPSIMYVHDGISLQAGFNECLTIQGTHTHDCMACPSVVRGRIIIMYVHAHARTVVCTVMCKDILSQT
jgi:hypothetical protein